MTNKLIPIDSREKELCILCIIDLVYYPYMSPEARDLYDTITKEEKEEIKKFFEKKGFFQELFNDPRIIIEDCSECCACAGW